MDSFALKCARLIGRFTAAVLALFIGCGLALALLFVTFDVAVRLIRGRVVPKLEPVPDAF